MCLLYMIAVHKTCNMVIEPISKEITGTVFKKRKSSRLPQFSR